MRQAPDSGLPDSLERACNATGFRPWGALRTEQAPSVIGYAAAGLGPALVPANTIPSHVPGAFPRPDPPLRRQLTGYTRTSPDRVTASFLETLGQHAPLMPAHVSRRLRAAECSSHRPPTDRR